MFNTLEEIAMIVDVKYIHTPYGDESVCKNCGGDVEWVDCDSCEGGFSYHDCGEDCCNCKDPTPNIRCDICEGREGWYVCHSCDATSSNIRKAK